MTLSRGRGTEPGCQGAARSGCASLAAFGNEEAVSAIAAAVDDAGDVLVHVVEEEEVVAQQLHLLDRFFDVHRLHREALGTNEVSDILFVVQVRLVDGRDRIGLEDTTAVRLLTRSVAARTLVVDTTDLALELIERLVDGHHLVRG